MLLVLFGYPGAGKSFIGKMLQDEFGFYHYEADDDLTPPIKEAIQKNYLITEPLREKYYETVCNKIELLRDIYPQLVITQTFTKEKERKRILDCFPETRFIWVQAELPVIYSRFAKRDNHLVKNFYAAFAISLFELPQIPHSVLMNNNGTEKIRHQLIRILDLLDQLFQSESLSTVKVVS